MNIYRTPCNNLNNFIELLYSVLNKIQKEIRRKHLIITEDLNVNFSGHSNAKLLIVDVLQSFT